MPAAPPSAGDVLRHGANVGFGALGLARRAVGTALGPGATVRAAIRHSRRLRRSTSCPARSPASRSSTERRVRIGGGGRRLGYREHRARRDAARRRPACAATARRPALELERDRAPRAGPKPRRSIGAPADAGAAGHRERHRAARLRAYRRPDPDRGHRRTDRHRSDRGARRPRRCHPRVHRRPHHGSGRRAARARDGARHVRESRRRPVAVPQAAPHARCSSS